MLPEDIDAVTASYHRAMHGGHFVDTFYDSFLAKSPEVARKFRRTDFAHQKLALRQSLLLLILFNSNPESIQEELEKLAIRHSRQGVDIAPSLYTLWLDSLCEAVERHDPEFTPEIEELWKAAMQHGIDLLISRY
jgi:hemoglobin-like flavoprotein